MDKNFYLILNSYKNKKFKKFKIIYKMINKNKKNLFQSRWKIFKKKIYKK